MHSPLNPTIQRRAGFGSRSMSTPSVRRVVTDLNRQFLERLIRTPEEGEYCDGHYLMGDRVPAAQIERQTLDAMAACPFTLFELKLLEPLSVATLPVFPQVRDDVHVDVEASNFEDQALAQATLIFASQLADTAPSTLTMTLGLSAATQAVIRKTPLTRLPECLRSRHALRARWRDHPHFWPTLLTAAQQQDAASLKRVYCLGLTLLAGDYLRPVISISADVG